MKRVSKQLKAGTPILAIVLTANPLLAEAAGPVAPGAGELLQQVKPVEPAPPSSTGKELKIEPEGAAPPPPSIAFEVKAIQITGNTVFDTALLHALVMDGEGQSLTLIQLNGLAARITDYYRRHGYPLARAIIPAQKIEDGRVRIEVIEARYGKIDLRNKSQVNDSLLNATLSPLQSGQAIEQETLDRSLLLFSDIPGVAPGFTLKPGEAAGTSDLVVDAAPGPRFTGYVALDNYGNAYTGRTHLGGAVNFINPLHHGDVLSVDGLSAGRGMSYGRIGYESLLNGRGTRMGGSYSALQYILGDTFAPLEGHGTAQVGSLWIRHPLERSRSVNFYGQLQYDHKDLRDHLDLIDSRTDRRLDNGTAKLSGDLRDGLLSGGISTWNIAWTSGRVSFDDANAQLADAATVKTQGSFSKFNAILVRLQNLGLNVSLYLAFSAQWASKNLDPSEKMVAGGPYTVRAYDMGVLSGDDGYLGTAEIRYNLGLAGWGRYQAVGFIDTQHVTVNKNSVAAGRNDASLTGAGVGIDCLWPGLWTARAYIATPIGATPELVASAASVRAWAQISKGF